MTPLFCVDAFTEVPFAGNPAGVCLLEKDADAAWMQQIAAELGMSETAFLSPGSGGFQLRWFTPSTEVALCGHATLASAHVLCEHGVVDANRPIRFVTRSGKLGAERRGERILLDFPARPPKPVDPPPKLGEALGTHLRACLSNGMDYLIILESEVEVRELTPDMDRLAAAGGRGVIVTARSERPEFDFVSRFFAPSVGIPEDPVTGSAHCALGPYWSEELGKRALRAYQASPRGGVIDVESRGDRVRLGGRAVTVWRGSLGEAARPAFS